MKKGLQYLGLCPQPRSHTDGERLMIAEQAPPSQGSRCLQLVLQLFLRDYKYVGLACLEDKPAFLPLHYFALKMDLKETMTKPAADLTRDEIQGQIQR
jgi:hypothetical protein